MAIYSNNNRLKLAKWVMYTICYNVIILILLFISWKITLGSALAASKLGEITLPALLFCGIALMIYKKLQKPEDDGWRNLAEILGSIQVFYMILSVLLLIGAIIFGMPLIPAPQVASSSTVTPIPTLTLIPFHSK
jgi:hypothetical protein